MTAVSEPVEPTAAPRHAGLAGVAGWGVLWLVFVAAAVVGCVAAIKGKLVRP